MKECVKNNVFEFRKERGETQEELAAVLGVTRQTVIAIERGNYTPSVALALKIAKHWKTSVELLFTLKK